MVDKNIPVINNRWLLVVSGLFLLWASFQNSMAEHSTVLSIAGLLFMALGVYFFIKAKR